MERIDQMAILALDTFQKCFVNDIKEMVVLLESQKEHIINNITEALKTVLQAAAHWQNVEKKGPLNYISFSFLNSNLLLNHYAIRVDAWDERFFIDENEASSEWDFQNILCGTGLDMDAVSTAVKKTMIIVQEYELKELERAYLLNYYAFAIEVLKIAIPFCTHVMSESPAMLATEVQFTVGTYMEKQQPFYTWRLET